MPIKDFLAVIDRITPPVDPHNVLVIFTGGEPLVRREIETCGLELYRRIQ
jgi:organic radical activating enzyme